jgi:S1-C subfamily serine protease
MFRNVNKIIRESIYGVLCKTPLGADQVTCGTGTAFMIAPGICATAAHVLHLDGDKTKPLHQSIELIRSPDIGSAMLNATLIAEDVERDLALIRITNPKNNSVVTFHKTRIDSGINTGALGFPLAQVAIINNQLAFNLTERFQGAYTSAYNFRVYPGPNPYNITLDTYETDSLTYTGSSGCPGFTLEGKVFGMVVGSVSEKMVKDNSARLAISLWVPSMDIINFAGGNGVVV